MSTSFIDNKSLVNSICLSKNEKAESEKFRNDLIPVLNSLCTVNNIYFIMIETDCKAQWHNVIEGYKDQIYFFFDDLSQELE